MATSFQIQIENPRITYTAGDTVRGQVVLQSIKAESVGLVSIVFLGRGKTKFIRNNGNNRRVYRGRAPLFQQIKVLYQGHYTLKPDRYAWPFEFTFPSHSDPTCVEDVFEESHPFLPTCQSHPLPPSFHYYDNNSRNQGMVEYKLEAKLNHNSNASFFSTHLDTECQLKYMPTRALESPDPRILVLERAHTARTLKLLPDKQELNFKEKVHSFFNPGDLPSAMFAVRLSYPTVTYPDRKLPIHLAVVLMKTSDDVPIPPTIKMTSLTVKIKSSYIFRTTGMWDRESHVEREQFSYHAQGMQIEVPCVEIPGKTKQEIRTLPLSTPVPATYLDISNKVRSGLKTPAICPSFQTINVAVSYRLKIKIKFDCAGSQFEVDYADVLTVLPASSTSRSNVRSNSLPPPNGIFTAPSTSQDSEVHDLLPTYTENADPDTEVLETGGPSNPPAYVDATEQSEIPEKAVAAS